MNGTELKDRILHASHEGVQVLRFVGEIRHPLSPPLQRFLDQTLKGKPRGLLIDLSETKIIDSTCLGLLARTAMRMRNQGLGRLIVVSPRADITEVLRSLSLDRLCGIVGEMPLTTIEERILATPGTPNEDTLLATMLDAHRTLMSMSEHNQQLFKDVVKALEREYKAGFIMRS